MYPPFKAPVARWVFYFTIIYDKIKEKGYKIVMWNLLERVLKNENYLLLVLFGTIGLLLSGIFTIFLFNREFFMNVETIKLILLAISVCSPSFFAILVVLIIIDNEVVPGAQITIALIMNSIVFTVMLFVKVFWREMPTNLFISGLGIIGAIVIWTYKKGTSDTSKG